MAGTAVVVLLAYFFIALVVSNQKRFMRAQQEKLRAVEEREEALRESELRYRHLVKYSPLPMVILADTIVQYANDAAIALLKAGAEQEVVGKEIDCFILNDGTSRDAMLRQMRESGAEVRVSHERVRRLDGEARDVETTSLPVVFEGKRALHLVIRDITDAKRAEAALREIPHQIIRAEETERRRVSRELHDGVNQILASVQFRLKGLSELTVDPSSQAYDALMDITGDLEEAIDEIQRISHNLRPGTIDDLGLFATVKNFLNDFSRRTEIPVDFSYDQVLDRFAPEVETALFRIIQEALNNVEKHSEATHAEVCIAIQGKTIAAKVIDNGIGIGSPSRNRMSRGRPGIGLETMKERAASVGGTVRVERREEGGTEVRIIIPSV